MDLPPLLPDHTARLSIGTLIKAFRTRVFLTWTMTLVETALLAIIPLFIGFAIDGLLEGNVQPLLKLAVIMFVLVLFAVARRLYDTRVYSAIRVAMGQAQSSRAAGLPISTLNARLGMGRELVEFMEQTLPEAMTAAVQLAMSIVILLSFSAVLSAAALIAACGLALTYALFHKRFYRINGAINQQTEQQVTILDTRRARPISAHLLKLRRMEVAFSDAEALLYGAIFLILLSFVLFNLWFAASQLEVTVGAIFSIISYSWEFVESALALPITLQQWSRLSEITERLNTAAA